MDPLPLLPTNTLPAAVLPASAVPLLKLVAGDIAQLPVGQPVPATVVKAAAGEMVLSVAGQQVTVRGTVNVAPGDVLSVRVQPGATVAVMGKEQPAASTPNQSTGVPTTPTSRRRGEVGADAQQSLRVRGDLVTTNPSPAGFAPLTPGTSPQRGEVGGTVNPLMQRQGQPPPPLPAGEGSPRAAHEAGVGPKNPAVQTAGLPALPQRGVLPGYRPPPQAAPEPAVVDVVAREPNGQYRVRIDGRETTADSQQPLQPGGRYVVQVDRGPTGVLIRPLPDSPQLPTTVATTILRTEKPPPIGDTLPSLVKELTLATVSLPAPRAEPEPARGAGSDIQKAAAEVREVAVKLLPSPDQPPTAERLKMLVEDGGTHFEAKFARAADPASPDRPAPPAPHTDLKSGLLSLARTVTDLAAAFPAAAATLDGIERQQAVNVLAQQNGGMMVVQIPFPDGPHWRTLGLGIEPDRGGERDADGRATGFRVMMHVPLTALGETWIDASAESQRLRAVLYVSDPAARERVRAELSELRGELQAGGFAEVSLDVRPAGDLTDTQRRKANAIREGVPEGGGLLDVRA